MEIAFGWHPAYWTSVIGGVMVLAGFAVLLIGWRGVAALTLVPLQVPFGASAGLAGLGLVGLGAALINLQVTRHLAARERARTRAVLTQATAALIHARDEGSLEG